MTLTPKQAAFVQEYLIDLNATQAAIRAGYSSKDADVTGPRLLGNVGIQEAIQAAMAERSERTQINQDWVLKRLALLADANPKKLASWDEGGVTVKDSDELTDDEAYLINEVILDETIKESKDGSELVLHRQKRLKPISDNTKAKALELIGKHLGMFTDKLKIQGDLNHNVNFKDVSEMSNEELDGFIKDS